MSVPVMPSAVANGDPPQVVIDPNVSAMMFEAPVIVTGVPIFVSPYSVSLSSFYSRPDVQAAQRRVVAQQFAQVVANLRGVEEVWLDSTIPELQATVIMRALDLERELEMRGIFISLTEAEPTAQLSVFATEDKVPDWAREGERLT